MVVEGNVLVRGVPVDRHLHLRVSVRVVAEFGGQHLLEFLKGPLNADSKYSHALQNKEARDVTEEQRQRFRRRRCVVVQRLADVRALGGSFVGECKDGANQRSTCASGACVLYAKEPFTPMN